MTDHKKPDHRAEIAAERLAEYELMRPAEVSTAQYEQMAGVFTREESKRISELPGGGMERWADIPLLSKQPWHKRAWHWLRRLLPLMLMLGCSGHPEYRVEGLSETSSEAVALAEDVFASQFWRLEPSYRVSNTEVPIGDEYRYAATVSDSDWEMVVLYVPQMERAPFASRVKKVLHELVHVASPGNNQSDHRQDSLVRCIHTTPKGFFDAVRECGDDAECIGERVFDDVDREYIEGFR